MGKSILANEELLREAVENSSSMKECLEYVGLRAAGSNYKTLRVYCELHGLEVPDGTMNNAKNLATYNRSLRLPNDRVFCENSNYSRTNLKERIVKEKMLPYRCSCCGLEGLWNGKPISLHLDHINGVHDDNRINNLRFLCPNCHSQTITYAGRSSRRSNRRVKNTNPSWRNQPRPHKRKVQRPSREELKKLLENSNYSAIGRHYGVSDNAVRKWAKGYDIL